MVYYDAGYKEIGELPANVRVMEDKVSGVLGDHRVSAIALRSGNTIAVDRTMATNLPGCYAAGDCTGRPYQYAKAVGEGDVAAHSVIEYLAEIEKRGA